MSKSKSEVLKLLPDHIKVLGKKFKIKVLEDGEFEDADGIMDLRSQTIGVRDGSSKAYAQDTVLHETLHAVDESLNLRLTEKQIHQMACGLLAVLKDNKEFSKWLLEEE